jgi:hypothetical protein
MERGLAAILSADVAGDVIRAVLFRGESHRRYAEGFWKAALSDWRGSSR